MQTPRSFQQKIIRRLRVVENQLTKMNVMIQEHKETSDINIQIMSLTSFCAVESIQRIEAAILNFRNWEANKGNAGGGRKRGRYG